MKIINAYTFPDRLLVHPMAKTSTGLWFAIEPYVTLERNGSMIKLGEVILSILDIPAEVVERPDDWAALNKARYKAAGVSSERFFQKQAKLVEVSLKDELIYFEPTHNGGSAGDNKGFMPLKTLIKPLPKESSAQEIGKKLLLAFDYCTSV